MARTSGDGRARATRARLPSAQELAIRRNRESQTDPTIARRVASGRGGYAMSAEDAIAAASLMDRSQVVSPFAGLPVSASVGEFGNAVLDGSPVGNQRELNRLFKAMGDEDIYGEYWDDEQRGYDYQNLATTTIGPDGRPVGGPVVSGPNREPAPISLVPTSTINPERPRTVAAGYDGSRSVLTVVFRDGTFYNYYDVTEGEWAAFKTQKSKGRYILAVLDGKPRGTASMANASMRARAGLYRVARTGQWIYDGQLGGQTDRTRPRINPTAQP